MARDNTYPANPQQQPYNAYPRSSAPDNTELPPPVTPTGSPASGPADTPPLYGAQAPNPGGTPYGNPHAHQSWPSAPMGQPTYNPYGSPSSKSRLAAGLFGIFLGTLGIHNFYLGHVGKGVTQLLLTVLSLGFLAPAVYVWGLIEAVLIFTSTPDSSWGRDADGRPLRG